jgi:hypothetical protein
MYTYTYRGSLVIRAESKVNSRDLLNVTFKGAKLSNKDGFFGTSDPFLVISRYAAIYKKCTYNVNNVERYFLADGYDMM